MDELNTISYEEYMLQYADYFQGQTGAVKNEVKFDATSNWVFRDESGNVVELKDGTWTMTVGTGETATVYHSVDEAVAAGYDKSELVYIDEFDGKQAI